MTHRVRYLRLALAPPPVAAQPDLVVLEALEELRKVVADDADLVVVNIEASVGFETEQLGVDGGEIVVGEEESRHLLVVLLVNVEAAVGRVVDVVVGEVEHHGVGGEGGEGVEALAGAVHNHRVRRLAGRVWLALLRHREVEELTGAAGRAERDHQAGVVADHGQQGGSLAGVRYLAAQSVRVELGLHWAGQAETPGVEPGQGGEAEPGVLSQVQHRQGGGERLQHLGGHRHQPVVGQIQLPQPGEAGET